VLNRLLLAAETVALLMIQPSQLLENLCVIWITVKHAAICTFGIVILWIVSLETRQIEVEATYVFLLLVNVSNLKPDILFGEWSWWNGDNVAEALSHVRFCATGEFAIKFLPLDSAGTSAVVCKLCRGGSKSRWPFQSRVACA